MLATEPESLLSAFLRSGIYRFDDANAFFIDPVRVLNRSYTRFRISPAGYYSRFFPSSSTSPIDNSTKKRKRRGNKMKKPRGLNSREQLADKRHQEVREGLLKAHEALIGAGGLLGILGKLRSDAETINDGESFPAEHEINFVELGSVYQAPFYEIVLKVEDDSGAGRESCRRRVFDNLVCNERSNDMEAELLNHKYILPKESCFCMSDLTQIHKLIPAESDGGFNLIVIDPPWENGSVYQKQKYRSLPNRHFLSLPIKQLTHRLGALVALWVTNREKLRSFVEKELFPKWGVEYAATFYWLKVKADGSLISELDLFHHRPYECLVLGFSPGKVRGRAIDIPDNQVVMSVPGDYSRKPPIGELLLDYAPGPKPPRCIELFGREMLAGWTTWGNEPLHFQDSTYFLEDKQT